MRKTVLSFGETLWDLLPTGAVLGGAPFNFAYRVNSLGDRGIIVSALGTDDLGDEAWEKVTALGIETTFLQRDQGHPTGKVEISFDEDRNPDYFIVPGVAYDHVRLTDELVAEAKQADCVCFGTLVQRSETTRRTLEQVVDAASSGQRSGPDLAAEGAVKLLDINLRKDCYGPDTVESSLGRADILKLNDDEARELAGLLGLPAEPIPDFCEAIIEKCALTHCVVTLGERGAFAASREGEAAYAAGYGVDLVDPCGSGDAFTAGFIHKLLRGSGLAECCTFGNAMGAMVAAQEGATVPITRREIDSFLAADHERAAEESLAKYAV